MAGDGRGDASSFVLQVAVTKGRGGIITAVRHYGRMLSANGLRHSVIYRGPALDALRAEGFDVIDAPPALTSPILGRLDRMSALAQAVRERASGQPLLAVIHSDRALRAISQLWPAAVLVTPCHSDKVKRKREADLVLTLNPSQHERTLSELVRSRARTIMLGNPYVSTQPDSAPPAAAPRLVFCGRFTTTKDPLILLRAARRLKIRPVPQIVFIGAGPLEAELREMAVESGLDVAFPGWLSQPFGQITRNDILVSTSSWEGLPYLLQEALDHGVNIVASDNAGSRCALGDGAFGGLFPVGDEIALAKVLEAALTNLEELRARSERGRLALKARYGAQPFWHALSGVVSPLANARRAHV